MLYRIAELNYWVQAQQNGLFISADLAAEGFIHASERSQILETARRYYADKSDLILLEIEEATLAAEGVRVEREWVESRQEYFPHIFGPVPIEAIRQYWAFLPAGDGHFRLPKELEAVC